jgi:hypothetical protein
MEERNMHPLREHRQHVMPVDEASRGVPDESANKVANLIIIPLVATMNNPGGALNTEVGVLGSTAHFERLCPKLLLWGCAWPDGKGCNRWNRKIVALHWGSGGLVVILGRELVINRGERMRVRMRFYLLAETMPRRGRFK